MNDDWTNCHDLALVFLALAYGPDHQIAERELAFITDALDGWGRPGANVQEVVMEALAVLLDDEFNSDEIITNALDRLAKSLSLEERQRAVEELVRIADADGALLRTERTTIAMIAHRWDVKDHAVTLLDVAHGDLGDWTLLHDIGLVYIILAHSTDGELSKPEIDMIVERAHGWQPDWEEEQVRVVLREALTLYSTDPSVETLRRSLTSIQHRLPMVQRLALIDDLYAIAEVDGGLTDAEQEMIGSLCTGWRVSPIRQSTGAPAT